MSTTTPARSGEKHREPSGVKRQRSCSWVELALLPAGAVLCFLYAWTLDDAYIYYRYADNAVLWGRGLVFNEGEFVEGFSSPLWMIVLLAMRGLAARLDILEYATFWNLQRAVAVGCFVWFWWLCVGVNRALTPRDQRTRMALNLPLLVLCLDYSVLSYFSSGTESPLVLVAAAAYARFLFTPRSWLLGIFLGLTPLIRHELAVPLALALAWSWHSTRRFPVVATLTAAFAGGGYLCFRIYYYADLFPNTFYLKNIWWLSSGFAYLLDTAVAHALPLALIAMLTLAGLVGVQSARARDRLAVVAVMLVLSLSVAAYVVKIGGDARHFRYLAFPYTLAILAFGGGCLEMLRSRFGVPAASVAGVAVAVASLAAFPVQLVEHPLRTRLNHLGAAPPVETTGRFSDFTDAAAHRRQPVWDSQARLEDLPDELIASGEVRFSGNCKVSYTKFRADYVIHKAGLTDPFISRMALEFRRPGHPIGHTRIAEQLAQIRRRFGKSGAFGKALRANAAPSWLVRNQHELRLVERKAYNEHDFGENLALALTIIDDLPLSPVRP